MGDRNPCAIRSRTGCAPTRRATALPPFHAALKAARICRSGRSSVIIVSHHIGTVKDYCQRCAVLRKGRLYYFDNVDEAERFYEAA